MINCVFDNLSLVLFNTQVVICFCTDINIYSLIKKYNDSNIELDNLDSYLSKNIWSRFYSITISLINLSCGLSYNYTVPPEVLQEINDNSRLVVSYQCDCYKDFPNFTWFNLWEYCVNIKNYDNLKI